MNGGKRTGRSPETVERWIRLAVVAAIALGIGSALWSTLGTGERAEAPPRVITLYGFSVLGPAIQDGVFPAFRDEWARRTGERVELAATFAASGRVVDDILRQVPVEIAVLASEIDAEHLAERGFLLGRPWGELPHGGKLCRTPLVLVTRPGNPLGLRTLGDLGREGVAVVMPDPRTSGAGEWSLAALGGCSEGTDPLAYAFLGNVARRLPSAREALAAFLNGDGDAMIAYEQQARGLPAHAVEVITPPCTGLVEPVVVRLMRNVDPADAELIDAFTQFLWSEPAQRALAAHGFRPADAALQAGEGDLADVERLLTVESLGGARAVRERLARTTPGGV